MTDRSNAPRPDPSSRPGDSAQKRNGRPADEDKGHPELGQGARRAARRHPGAGQGLKLAIEERKADQRAEVEPRQWEGRACHSLLSRRLLHFALTRSVAHASEGRQRREPAR